MQTFLPYPTYRKSLWCLDRSRLGNQIYREGKAMLWLTSPSYDGKSAWAKGALAEMWRPHRYQLAFYCLVGVKVMAKRNELALANDEKPWFRPEVIERWSYYFQGAVDALPHTPPPPWLGDERLHSSHRSMLLQKNFEWYNQFGWKEEPGGPYFWSDLME